MTFVSSNECHAKEIRCVWKNARLGDKSQAVHVNSNESAIMVLKFGVPQRSVLGSKIFTNYAEDVSEIFNQHDLFADDMQCLCYKPAEVPSVLKTVIDVCTWCAAKRLQLNADKTEILWFGSAVYLRKLSADELVRALSNQSLQFGILVF